MGLIITLGVHQNILMNSLTNILAIPKHFSVELSSIICVNFHT
jgi:hypothetical protein